MLHLVSATRLSRERFMRESLLGKCLPRIGEYEQVGLTLFAENQRPIGVCYNEVIDSAAPDDILVFVHDDVYIDDWFLNARLTDALNHFDVIGVAGNQRLQPNQEAWHLEPGSSLRDPNNLRRDTAYLSGAVAHGASPASASLTKFGPSPSRVAVLDGVFLATRALSLNETKVRFDPALGFHFYDLDFCRSATQAGLRLGTWPIALTHQSRGESIFSQAWSDSLDAYLDKWRNP